MKNFDRKSKYYPPNQSWTGSSAWAFEVPLGKLHELNENGTVTLRCQLAENPLAYRNLSVPAEFLKSHLSDFFIRNDRNAISLFLSAEPSNEFVEQRGKQKLNFSKFEI